MAEGRGRKSDCYREEELKIGNYLIKEYRSLMKIPASVANGVVVFHIILHAVLVLTIGVLSGMLMIRFV